tara:strand:- start:887 stop:1477 length:591 start_codon:yes stop_codon:yes gene_type:complete
MIRFELYNTMPLQKKGIVMYNNLSDIQVAAAEQYKPRLASEDPPGWYTSEHPLNRCPGVTDYFRKGWLVRSFENVYGNVTMEETSAMGAFSPELSKGLQFAHGHLSRVFKLKLPYHIVSDVDTTLLFCDATYHDTNRDGIRIFQGIIPLKKNKKIQLNPIFSVSEHYLEWAATNKNPVFRQGEIMMQLIEMRRAFD